MGEIELQILKGRGFGGVMSNWFVSFEEFCEEFVFLGGVVNKWTKHRHRFALKEFCCKPNRFECI